MRFGDVITPIGWRGLRAPRAERGRLRGFLRQHGRTVTVPGHAAVPHNDALSPRNCNASGDHARRVTG